MLVNIQFLRFVAATLVAAYHTAAYMPPAVVSANPLFAFSNATGFAGVDIFFVISGFIMAHTTLQASGAHAASEFARRRLARIYSGYWPVFILAVAIFAWARPAHFEKTHLLASFWLWPQRLPYNLIELSWTLSFEMYFYALFALLVWWCPPRHRLVSCAAIMALLAAWAAARQFHFDTFSPAHLALQPFWPMFLASPYVVEFFAGAVLAYWLQDHRQGMAWPLLLAAVALFIGGGVISETLFDGRIEQGYYVFWRVALFGTTGVLAVAGLVRLETRHQVAPRRLSLLMGGASYAIYLLHGPLLALARKLGIEQWLEAHAAIPVWVAYLLLLGLILALSALHYRMLERPLHRTFRRWLRVADPQR